MVVSGFRIVSVNYDKLSQHNNITLEKHGQLLYQLENSPGFRWLKIEDNTMFGTLVAGIKNTTYMKQTYSRMDIVIRNNSLLNFQNSSMGEFKVTMKHVISYIEKKYGVVIDYDTLRLKEMEINCTFKIKEKFSDYHRVLRLMMFNLPDRFKKLGEFSNINKIDYQLETETFFRGNNAMLIKIYDKKRQVENLTNTQINGEYMRIEISIRTSQKIVEIFKTRLLSEIDDLQVIDYFFTQFNKLFVQQYHNWKRKNMELLHNLILQHKKRNLKSWKSTLLMECSNFEQKDRIPILLSIEDLFEDIKQHDRHGHFQRIKSGLIEQCKFYDVYLKKDTEKALEIFSAAQKSYQNSISHISAKSKLVIYK